MRLLVLLAENAPDTTTRDQIIERLWDGRAVTDDAINKQLSKLRAALQDPGRGGMIETVPKVGIRLNQGEPGGSATGLAHRSFFMTAIKTIALISGLAVFAYLVSHRDGETNFIVSRAPASATPGIEQNPALSRDGKSLAYVSRDPEGRFGVFIKPVEGDVAERVTPKAIDARVPAWSSDGRLAFVITNGPACSIAVGLPRQTFQVLAKCVAARPGESRG
jgi:hypothetical protein